MKVGDIYIANGVNHVVTSTVNGKVASSKPLRDYITSTHVIQHNGEYKSIMNVIDETEAAYINAMGEPKEVSADDFHIQG